MQHSIPDFTTHIEPFRKVLEEAYELVRKRTKREMKRISLKYTSCNEEHEHQFREFQHELQHSVKR